MGRRPIKQRSAHQCRSRYCVGILSAALWSVCGANESVLSETDLFSDIAPITTASRLSQQRADAPAAITVIDRAMIDASGAQEISDLMRLVPGFQAYHVNGHKFGVTAHGLGTPFPGRLEVMLDGRSVYLTAFSSPDWRTLAIGIDDIERIEVVRSPSASSWGSNAFQGAINIITRQPALHRDAEGRASLGNHDATKVELRHFSSLAAGEARLSGGYQQSDGFGGDDQGQSRYISLRHVISPSLSDELDLQAGFADGNAGIGNSDTGFLGQRDFNSHYQSATWQRQLANGHRIQVRAYHNYLRYRMERISPAEYFSTLPIPPAALGISDGPIPANLEEGATHRYDLELQHQITLPADIRLLWGVGGRLDTGKSPLLLNTDRRITERFWRLFSNLEWQPAPNWLWNLGVMAEYSDIAHLQISPRIALNYTLDHDHRLRASFSEAYRTPSLLEANQDTRLRDSSGQLIAWVFDAAEDLDAEQNRTTEVGYLGLHPTQPLELDVRLFHEEVRNAIGRMKIPVDEPQLLDPLFPPLGLNQRTTNTNNAAWTSDGFELQLRFRPSPRQLISLAYGFIDTHGGMTPGAADDPLDPELNFANMVPKHTLALLGSHQLQSGLVISGALYHQTASRWFIGSQLHSYTRVDLRLARSFKLGGANARLSLIGQNLGAGYKEFQQRNDFETRYFISLSIGRSS